MRKNPLNYLGAPILSLQAMLAVLSKSGIGIPAVIPDGLYGPETARAVTEFQRLHALPETGQTDHTTWNHIVDAFTRLSPLVLPAAPLEAVWQPMQTISAGEKNLQLHVIQGMLSALRHVFPQMPPLRVTGVHDADSVRAVRWLQRKSGLRDDGVLTQIDWLYLAGLYRLAVGDGVLRAE